MSKTKTPPNPYLDARREWNERYGDYVATARFSQVIAYTCTLIALISVAGAIWIAGQKRVVPYAIEIDKAGAIQDIRPINGKINGKIKAKIIAAQIAAFVEKFRDVTLDAKIQRENVVQVYVYLRKNTPGFNKITNWFRKNDPFERAKKETVFVKITRIMPLKDNAWQVEWRETVMDRKTGQALKADNYKMIAYTTISPPTDEAAIIKNPLGIIISDLNWSKEIGE